MKGRQSKCNYCIHALLRCSHSPSCAFKLECENRTLVLLQRFVGLVFLELSEFSQSGNNFSRASDDASCICFRETKDKYFNRSLRHGIEMRHWNLHSDSVLVDTGYIGTGAILVPVLVPNPTYTFQAGKRKQNHDGCRGSNLFQNSFCTFTFWTLYQQSTI